MDTRLAINITQNQNFHMAYSKENPFHPPLKNFENDAP
jgi:hypothetical protein